MQLDGVIDVLASNAAVPESSRGHAEMRFGLLGRGISGSLTPAMHQREAQRLGLDLSYDLIDFDVLGIENAQLDEVIEGLKALNYKGFNVTFPFKQSILSMLDTIADDAKEIGAVNTVTINEDGSMRGHNTDCWGFAEGFRQTFSQVARGQVLQLGAGGAGGAVARALLDLGTQRLCIYDTEHEKAAALAHKMDAVGGKVFAVSSIEEGLKGSDGIVNATPVGMSKLPGVPIDPDRIGTEQWVADIIYFPRETELLARARAAGCAVLDGSAMAVFQAVRAFELFTGRVPDAKEMARTFRALA